jgi:hypothetical protein
MYEKIINNILQELYHITPPVSGPSAIMSGPTPTGFKGSNVGGIAQGAQIPVKIKKRQRLKKKKKV